MSENNEQVFTDINEENSSTPPVQPIEAVQEKVLAGIVGAFLFSLAGGVICAIKGYAVFGKRESLLGIIISTVIAFLVIVIAWYICLSYDVYLVYQDWYANGEVEFSLTFFESVANAHLFLSEPEIAIAYLKDLGIGLVFCVIGAFGYVKAAISRVKNR